MSISTKEFEAYIIQCRAHLFAMENYKLIDPGYEGVRFLEALWARRFWCEIWPERMRQMLDDDAKWKELG